MDPEDPVRRRTSFKFNWTHTKCLFEFHLLRLRAAPRASRRSQQVAAGRTGGGRAAPQRASRRAGRDVRRSRAAAADFAQGPLDGRCASGRASSMVGDGATRTKKQAACARRQAAHKISAFCESQPSKWRTSPLEGGPGPPPRGPSPTRWSEPPRPVVSSSRETLSSKPRAPSPNRCVHGGGASAPSSPEKKMQNELQFFRSYVRLPEPERRDLTGY